ncbi:MAG: hypothetical protein ACI9JM_003417 [Halioglobus sp.]|jgi:hypothetical protein
MMNTKNPILNTFTLLIALLISYSATAEIYKWVDADGNVTFGDKPQDPKQAAKAEPVELRENYKPTELSTAQRKDIELDQKAAVQRATAQRRTELIAEDDAKAKRKAEKTVRCDGLRKELKTFGGITVDSGGRRFHYITDENGEAVSEDTQKKYVSDLKAVISKEGC